MKTPSNKTYELLKASGWYEGRQIDIKSIVTKMESLGFYFSEGDGFVKFFSEFGNLNLIFNTDNVQHRIIFTIGPYEHIIPDNRLKYDYPRIIGNSCNCLIMIGYYNDFGLLVIDNDSGEIYHLQDGEVISLGEKIEAIDVLINKLSRREVTIWPQPGWWSKERYSNEKIGPSTENVQTVISNIKKGSNIFVNLNKCNLTKIPQEVYESPNVIRLYFNSNSLQELSLEIGNLIELEDLDLSTNLLTELPESITDLEELTKLNLSNNQLNNKVINRISRLKDLRVLNLADNEIDEISETISSIVYLRELNLSNNKIKVIPTELFDCQFLGVLNLSYNKIEEFPMTLSDHQYLYKIDFSHNLMSEFADEFADIKNLQWLNLSNNQIEEIEHLYDLRNLEYLNLSSNQIKSIPVSIFKEMPRLKVLDLTNNPITEIPEEVKAIKGLEIKL